MDCGVNIILPKGSHSGNAYGHDRIMKFDLKKFGLSVVTEKITAKENGLNLKSIFGYDLVFGSAGIGNKLYDDCVNDNECYLPATLNDEE